MRNIPENTDPCRQLGEMPVCHSQTDVHHFEIKHVRTNEWHLSDTGIEKAASMTPWEHSASVRRFQKLMEQLGVEEALGKSGAKEGDTTYISDYELEWQE